MVSVVRWEPVVAEDYPSDITFWARVRGLPFQYWAAGSLWAVGKVLGRASEVDEDSGFLRVTVNGFEPLVFNTIIPFDNGDEVKVSIDYEKIANHCKHCFRLTHLASSCPDLVVPVDLGRGNKEENKQGLVIGSMLNEEHGWEMPRKRPVKRALYTTDFVAKESEGKQKDDGSAAGFVNQGVENNKFSYRDGRNNKKDGYRTGAWEGQSRGSKHKENIYRSKDGRVQAYGRGRSSGWPAPLYPNQSGASSSQGGKAGNVGQKVKELSVPEETSRGKDKVNTKDDMIGEDDLGLDGTLDMEDEDLLEDGELMLEDYEVEDPNILLFNNQEDKVAAPTEGNLIKSECLGGGFEVLNKELSDCSLVAPKGVKLGARSNRVLKGTSSRKSNLMLLVSPRKSNGIKPVVSKQGISAVQGTKGNTIEPMSKKEPTGQRKIRKKLGMVALPKLPANT